MGFFAALAAATGFRAAVGTIGIVVHLAGWATLPFNPPLAAVIIPVGDTMMAMVVAPPGVNPIENSIVVAATATPTL